MAVQKVSYKLDSVTPGERLDNVLARTLPTAYGRPISKGKIRKLIIVGAVHVNRARVKIASRPPRSGDTIDVYIDAKKLEVQGVHHESYELNHDEILLEDSDIIVVNKPPGLPTQPTLDQARDHLYGSVQRFLRARIGQRDAYVGLHHRLDHDTSGVVLFTKAKRANVGVANLFRDQQISKTYMALAHKPAVLPPDQWEVKNHLGKDLSSKKRMKIKSVKSGGDFAHTSFLTKEVLPKALLLEARLHTGRTHQIRVHLTEGGFPIWGDRTYGNIGESPKAPRLMLHARRLDFLHPVNGRPMSVEAPLPTDFESFLGQLR